jgi:hypothetical protein
MAKRHPITPITHARHVAGFLSMERVRIEKIMKKIAARKLKEVKYFLLVAKRS